MKNKILSKLRSQDGASITFALLLFLVCAVLCSVILAAATAASGRISKIAETDQKYYAVANAAELMRDMLDGKEVTITKIYNGTKTETYSGSSWSTSTNYDTTNYTLKINNNTVAPLSASFTSFIDDAAYKYNSGGGTGSLKIKASDGLLNAAGISGSDDPLEVSIQETVSSTGDIKLIIGDDYKMVLVFGATVNDADVVVATGNPQTVNPTTITTTITKTETTTLKWTFGGIKTNS